MDNITPKLCPLHYPRLGPNKIQPKENSTQRIFCPWGVGGIAPEVEWAGSGMGRAPRPHPQGKTFFFGLIFMYNYAKTSPRKLFPVDLFRLLSMRGAQIWCRNGAKPPGTWIFDFFFQNYARPLFCHFGVILRKNLQIFAALRARGGWPVWSAGWSTGQPPPRAQGGENLQFFRKITQKLQNKPPKKGKNRAHLFRARSGSGASDLLTLAH